DCRTPCSDGYLHGVYQAAPAQIQDQRNRYSPASLQETCHSDDPSIDLSNNTKGQKAAMRHRCRELYICKTCASEPCSFRILFLNRRFQGALENPAAEPIN